MEATSISARAPAARILATVCTELPSTYFTVAPVAFSKAAAWHFFELSTNVPPNVATTSSSADAVGTRQALSATPAAISTSMAAIRATRVTAEHTDGISRNTIMNDVPPASGGAIIRQPPGAVNRRSRARDAGLAALDATASTEEYGSALRDARPRHARRAQRDADARTTERGGRDATAQRRDGARDSMARVAAGGNHPRGGRDD